jgi:FPC/CPF motif-containing protein YcgG
VSGVSFTKVERWWFKASGSQIKPSEPIHTIKKLCFNNLSLIFQALSVARQLGATTYVETSARASTKGVKDAFEVAALAALGKLNKQQMKQQVLFQHRICHL